MSNETQLAPAAGAGIGKIIADKLLSDPEFIPLMIEAVTNGLRATRTEYTGHGKDREAEQVPDFKTQLQAFALLLAHMEGEPIKRVIHQHLGGTGSVDPLAALQDSPALRDAARRMLAKAEWRTNPGERSKAHAAAKRAQQVTEAEAIEV